MEREIKRLQTTIDNQNREFKAFVDAAINKMTELEIHLSILKDEIDEIKKRK